MRVPRSPAAWARVAALSLACGAVMVPLLWLYHWVGPDHATGVELAQGFAFGLAIGAFAGIARPDLFSGEHPGDLD